MDLKAAKPTYILPKVAKPLLTLKLRNNSYWCYWDNNASLLDDSIVTELIHNAMKLNVNYLFWKTFESPKWTIIYRVSVIAKVKSWTLSFSPQFSREDHIHWISPSWVGWYVYRLQPKQHSQFLRTFFQVLQILHPQKCHTNALIAYFTVENEEHIVVPEEVQILWHNESMTRRSKHGQCLQ